MSGRLVLAILSTLLEELVLAVIVLWGLPQISINIPLGGLVGLMVVWAVVSVVIYRIGSRALRRKPVDGLPHMVGRTGIIVSPLVPRGLVRISGELWAAISDSCNIDIGEEVVVVGQEGLKLKVQKIRNV